MNSPALPEAQTLPTTPAIRLSGITVAFEGREVLKGVDLEVRKGEFVAIIGPSGGGKSTLLRVVAGLLKAHSGTVEVLGRPAMVFQDYRLLPWRNVEQNIRLPIELTGRGKVETHLGMKPFLKLYPHQLSGGMKARVAIARALAQDAEVLLMDEPFAALDALVRERFNLELKRLHERTGKTILFVTHSIREAVYLADRVVVLTRGRIEAVLDTKGEGRLTAFTDGIEAELRERLGVADSTFIEPPPPPMRPPWEVFGVLGLGGIFFILWSLLSARIPLFMPSPTQVWRAMVDNAALLAQSALATLEAALLGTLVSLAAGLPLGYAMGRSRALERLFSPFIVALQAVPTIIIAPLLIIWFGYGLLSKVITVALISIFPVMVSTMVGVREVDRVYREVFQTMGATAWGVFSKLEFPGALPVVLGGLRLTLSLALIGAVVAEFVFGGAGLGYMANTERLNFRYANAFAAVMVTVGLGIALYALVAGLEGYVLRYRRR
ncbi:MAG: ABC transporter permease subunit [Meiothermus sp.]|uniref:ABC transporter permease subunit n=1 Tax=Meiothermus sp. TaxID=1955249 RepID=UPI0025F5F651|nr:ABC transporter permease subunit [Meiothermus sp.]MCS7059513.1 ABC transporter permease subunit [Meiothermus sp.]MCS7195087.1 ABC transporter permease subunit [Meiothermus sp.]MCX7740894.1 ABC transporter permease subunit [Meiothermus sp.]MDW8092045.1 ABC transporter permease subunit [Meiothermus sp.]MDW8482668.1 ABC transporter permease subunit [Meiothermus sp.]